MTSQYHQICSLFPWPLYHLLSWFFLYLVCSFKVFSIPQMLRFPKFQFLLPYILPDWPTYFMASTTIYIMMTLNYISKLDVPELQTYFYSVGQLHLDVPKISQTNYVSNLIFPSKPAASFFSTLVTGSHLSPQG